jgi:UDP-N-acetylglucosamine--N-acetylmuramyl-(pentapeptide) pyrophosphoryl-undecaprenol N-acetylglucosamine transferase
MLEPFAHQGADPAVFKLRGDRFGDQYGICRDIDEHMGVSEQMNSRQDNISKPLTGKRRKNPKESGLRIIFAGGGTGGHLFPGIAIAREFENRCPGTRVLFVSSGRPIEEKVLAKTGFETAMIRVEGIKGKSFWSKLKSALILPRGGFGAIALLFRFKPDMVMGLGGYSAGPLIMAAWALRIPRAICEQNQLPGVTNRILSHFSNRIYVSYKDTGLNAPEEKIRIFGNPVRREIIKKLQEERQEARMRKQKFTVLILGGSQGAHGLNMAVVDALGHLAHPNQFRFVHQSGAADAPVVARTYDDRQIAHTTAAFFDDMASLYRDADLVICRSGATTIAEVTIAGCSVIFVPFPHAADNHQVFNAKPLVDEGAAEMILESDLSGRLLAERIEFYAGHPEVLARMKAKIKAFGNPDAAARIVEDVYQLLEKRSVKMLCAA